MKKAFDVNLPKSSLKLRSSVATLASPSAHSSEELSEEHPRNRNEMRRRDDLRSPVVMLKPLANRSGTGGENGGAFVSMLEDLESELKRARQMRGTARAKAERARSVLTRTADTTSEALHRLATAEQQLSERYQVLTSLFGEIEQLEASRAEALELAQRLSGMGHLPPNARPDRSVRDRPHASRGSMGHPGHPANHSAEEWR